MYICLGKNKLKKNARCCAMVRILHGSNFLPLSHFSHLSVNLVQGVSQLHESLLRLCKIPKLHDIKLEIKEKLSRTLTLKLISNPLEIIQKPFETCLRNSLESAAKTWSKYCFRRFFPFFFFSFLYLFLNRHIPFFNLADQPPS